MEFKVSLRDRLKKARSSIFSFGSQVHSPIVQNLCSHTPAPNRPSSPVIERQYIPSDVEKQIRYSCYRLQRNIERGIPSRDFQAPRKNVDTRAKNTGRSARPQSSSLPTNFKAGQNIHGSGVVIGAQGPTDIAQFYERTGLDNNYDPSFVSSRIPSASTKDTAAQCDMPFYSGETLVGNESQASQDRRSNIPMRAYTDDDALGETCFEIDIDSMSSLPPSFSRPPGAGLSPNAGPGNSRLVRKRRFSNLHGISVKESQNDTDPTNTNHQQQQPKYTYHWLPRTTGRSGNRTGVRPASAIELGASYRRELVPPHAPVSVPAPAPAPTTATEAVIIDSNGVRRAMTAEQEQDRQRDLQQAVREKMYTGWIWPSGRSGAGTGLRPVSTTINTNMNTDTTMNDNDHNKRVSTLPCLDTSNVNEKPSLSENGKDASEPPSKRKSILDKLSFLGLFGGAGGKGKNGTLRSKDTVGFSRIVEAV